METFNKMESFWIYKSPEPDISVKNEVEFDAKDESEYAIVMENQIIPDNVTESELETGVQVKSEPEAVVWIKSEPETDIIEMEMKLETDLNTEFDVGSKCSCLMVRLFKFYALLILFLNEDLMKFMFLDALQVKLAESQ